MYSPVFGLLRELIDASVPTRTSFVKLIDAIPAIDFNYRTSIALPFQWVIAQASPRDP